MSTEEKNIEIEPEIDDEEKEVNDETDVVDDNDNDDDGDGDNTEDDDEEEDDDDDDDDDDNIVDDIEQDSQAQIDKLQTKGRSTTTKNVVSTETSNFIGEGQVIDDPDDQIDSDDEYNEDIFKKLESNFYDDISFIHPQSTEVNNKELKNLIKVVRNRYGIVVDRLHRTSPILSKYEYTKILGQRLSQLNNGYHSFVTREGHIDNTSIAEEEIKRKLLPIIIRRPLWSGASEYWILEDLEIFR